MDFARKTAKSKRKVAQSRLIKLSVIALSAITLLSASGFYFYKHVVGTNFIAIATQPLQNWISGRKKAFTQSQPKLKRPVAQKPFEESPIHFEFYTALPNTKMTAPNPPEEVVPKKEMVKPLVANNSVVTSPEELEKEFSEQIKLAKKPKREHT